MPSNPRTEDQQDDLNYTHFIIIVIKLKSWKMSHLNFIQRYIMFYSSNFIIINNNFPTDN